MTSPNFWQMLLADDFCRKQLHVHLQLSCQIRNTNKREYVVWPYHSKKVSTDALLHPYTRDDIRKAVQCLCSSHFSYHDQAIPRKKFDTCYK